MDRTERNRFIAHAADEAAALVAVTRRERQRLLDAGEDTAFVDQVLGELRSNSVTCAPPRRSAVSSTDTDRARTRRRNSQRSPA